MRQKIGDGEKLINVSCVQNSQMHIGDGLTGTHYLTLKSAALA